jgi:hypothetical protein
MPMQTYVDSNGVEVQAAEIKTISDKPIASQYLATTLVCGESRTVAREVFGSTLDFTYHRHMLILEAGKYTVLRKLAFDEQYSRPLVAMISDVVAPPKSSIGNAADFGVTIKPNVTYAKSGASIEELGVSDSAISTPKLSVIEPRPTEPKINETVVEILEEALRRAKSGEFQDLAYVAVNGDGNPCTAFNVDNHAVTALAGISILERDIMDLHIHLRADML